MINSGVTDTELLIAFWDRAIAGMVLLKKAEDDFIVINENAESKRINNNKLTLNRGLGEQMPGHKHILPNYNSSLLDLYFGAIESRVASQIEIYYDDSPIGWYKVSMMPVNEDHLLVSFIDISYLKTISITDGLTCVYNRRYLLEINREWNSCIYIDLDGFKLVNDTQGHYIGDSILQQLGVILNKVAVPEGGVAIRMGGDEFILLFGTLSQRDLYTIASVVLVDIIAIQLEDATISASMGISIADNPLLKSDIAKQQIEVLINAADLAATDAKQNKSSNRPEHRIKFWDTNLLLSKKRKKIMEAALRSNTIQEEFSLVYQPIFDIPTKTIIGAEALLRWDSVQLGNIAPDEFIPLAETTGQINHISEWVIQEALEQTKEWVKLQPKFSIALNISPNELEDLWLPDKLRNHISRMGLDPFNIELELTERGILQIEKCINTLKRLEIAKIRLKLDDFGMGYSGIYNLVSIKFDQVKVDKALLPRSLKDTDKMTVCKGIKAMSEAMGFELVAEGVETKKQFDIMRDLGYQYAQGYYLGKPMKPARFTELLKINPLVSN